MKEGCAAGVVVLAVVRGHLAAFGAQVVGEGGPHDEVFGEVVADEAPGCGEEERLERCDEGVGGGIDGGGGGCGWIRGWRRRRGRGWGREELADAFGEALNGEVVCVYDLGECVLLGQGVLKGFKALEMGRSGGLGVRGWGRTCACGREVCVSRHSWLAGW